ncbi:MAG: hypothetical protein V4640_12190 [Verrucomicrobiota bacterium]
MKTTVIKRRSAGYVSLLLVLSTGTLLTLLTINAYKRASDAHSVQSKTQLRVDYAEKEEAILRSVIAITPNRAIGAMKHESNLNPAASLPFSWQSIFNDSLNLANSRTSISGAMQTTLGVQNLRVANTGDSALATPANIFQSIIIGEGQVSAGINRSLGAGYPASLSCNDTTTSTNDFFYPIISDQKYDPLALANFGPQFNNRSKFGLLKYPKINFGYAKPGEDFVSKRNWWAFSVDVGGSDALSTGLARRKRDYVLSIYEIPSQLAISASAFMALGKFESGSEWENVKIDGGMFLGKAQVEGTATTYNTLASRRGMTVANGTAIGGETFSSDPFAAGAREAYQVDPTKILPVSQVSESGRAAFIPISRGKEVVGGTNTYPFFDRFANTAEANVLSSTTWNSYSSGSMQAAMRLDVTQVVSAINQTPTMLKFQYYPPTGNRLEMNVPQNNAVLSVLPVGFKEICLENQSYNLDTLAGGTPVDVAYGIGTGSRPGWTFRQGLSGTIRFDNATFGDPNVNQGKKGYWRPRAPFGLKSLASGQTCVAVYPERFATFLDAISAATTARNHSLVVNVDYRNIGPTYPLRPQIDPCRDLLDYGVILQECADLTSFSKGFSLVSNLRLYFGDDFNVVPTTPPTGYTPLVTTTNPTGRFMPPCSLFAPEKRYGVDVNPFGVSLSGQIGSLAQGDKVQASDTLKTVRPLDSKTMNGTAIASDRIEVNLSQLRHPAELPPITMMNWLVLLEERRSEYY